MGNCQFVTKAMKREKRLLKKGWGLKRAGADTWDVKADAEGCFKAMDGLGTREQDLIKILCDRSREHLQLVRAEYQTRYSKDLRDHVKKETSYRLKKILMARLTPRPELLAQLTRDAIKGAGTRMDELLLVLCPRAGWEIPEIISAYKTLYDRDMVEDIKKDTSAKVRKFLEEVLKGERDNDEWEIDIEAVKDDAKKLYAAGEGKLGTDEKEFLRILTSRSHAHLAQVRKAYADLAGHTFEKGLAKELSGPFRKACLYTTQGIGELYGEMLHKAFKGAGTNDDLVLAVLSILDLAELKMVNEYFLEHYKVSLHQAIQKEIAGPVKKAYLFLIPPTFETV